MEFYLPSFFIFLFAMLFIFLILPKLSPMAMGIIAIVMLVYGGYNHYQMFKDEYTRMSWVDGAKSIAPYLLVGGVLVYIVGYFLLIGGTGKVQPGSPMMPRSLPSAETATNPITAGINMGMKSLGIGNSSAPPPPGGSSSLGRPPNASRNTYSSATMSSLEKELGIGV